LQRFVQAAALLLCDRVTIFFGAAAGVAIEVDSNDSNEVDEAIFGSVWDLADSKPKPAGLLNF
jgi:hypothetical protein